MKKKNPEFRGPFYRSVIIRLRIRFIRIRISLKRLPNNRVTKMFIQDKTLYLTW